MNFESGFNYVGQVYRVTSAYGEDEAWDAEYGRMDDDSVRQLRQGDKLIFKEWTSGHSCPDICKAHTILFLTVDGRKARMDRITANQVLEPV